MPIEDLPQQDPPLGILKTLVGGDCYIVGSDALEGCVYDKIHGTEHDDKIAECTSEFFMFLVNPANRYTNLRNKYICLKRIFKTMKQCTDLCPETCEPFQGTFRCYDPKGLD